MAPKRSEPQFWVGSVPCWFYRKSGILSAGRGGCVLQKKVPVSELADVKGYARRIVPVEARIHYAVADGMPPLEDTSGDAAEQSELNPDSCARPDSHGKANYSPPAAAVSAPTQPAKQQRVQLPNSQAGSGDQADVCMAEATFSTRTRNPVDRFSTSHFAEWGAFDQRRLENNPSHQRMRPAGVSYDAPCMCASLYRYVGVRVGGIHDGWCAHHLCNVCSQVSPIARCERSGTRCESSSSIC